MGVSRRSLQDGKVLTLLLTRNQTELSVESLSSVFRCLRDSQVWLALEPPDKSTPSPSLGSGRPHLLQDGAGIRYLPSFPSPARCRKATRSASHRRGFRFLRCIDLVSELPGVEKIAVNPFGANLVFESAAAQNNWGTALGN